MSQNSYTVYIIHSPLLIFLALAMRGISTANLAKFALIAAIAVPLCYVVAFLVRKLPFVSSIL